MNTSPEKLSDLGSMKALEKGQSVSFEIRKLTTIRTNVSVINTLRGFRSLSSKTDRKARTITVTRIA